MWGLSCVFIWQWLLYLGPVNVESLRFKICGESLGTSHIVIVKSSKSNFCIGWPTRCSREIFASLVVPNFIHCQFPPWSLFLGGVALFIWGTLSLSNYAIMSGQWYYARETGAHSAQLTHNAHLLFPPVSNYSPQIKVIAELSDEGLAGIGRRHTCRNPPKLYYLSIQPFRTIYQKETEITAKFCQTNDWSENHILLLPQIFQILQHTSNHLN